MVISTSILKYRPKTKESKESPQGTMARIPPCRDRNARYPMSLRWEGSPNSFEYLFTTLSMYLSVEYSVNTMPL